jgi:hypothetical protein
MLESNNSYQANPHPSNGVAITFLALKEWAIAVDALTQGNMILLLRKGGIREQRFFVEKEKFWLYPTYEHQKPHLLKTSYSQQVESVATGWHPEAVPMKGWAEMTHCFQVTDDAAIAALEPFHIWNPQFVKERLHWKPQQPLSILLLRVYVLRSPQLIPYCPEYGGCKSWIELLPDAQARLASSESTAVLNEAPYQNLVERIQQILQS